MAASALRLPATTFHGSALGILAVGTVVGIALASMAGADALLVLGLAILLAAGLSLSIPLRWGGSVPLGYALGIALPVMLPWDHQVMVALGALAFALVLHLNRHAEEASEPAGPMVARMAVALAAAGSAVATFDAVLTDPAPLLARVVLASFALLAADAIVTRLLSADQRIDLASVLPVYLTLACGAALIAVAEDRVGAEMALVAALPLLITRFSFQRSAEAGDTLRQTVQALGLVPELAGMVPLGHSERSAHYARLLCEQLHLRRDRREVVVTAARLHHLGAVPFDFISDEGTPVAVDPDVIALQGGQVLTEAGFPPAVGALLAAARCGTAERCPSIDAAIVRVATSFDEVVGDEAERAEQGLAHVVHDATDRYRRRATAALVQLNAQQPSMVADAVASGDRFRQAASGVDFADVLAHRGGDVVPFARRRRSV
jgi:hypothetical protein